MSFLAGGLVSGIGSLLGGILGSNAAGNAAQQEIAAPSKKGINQVQQGEQNATGQQEAATNQITGELSPFLGLGTSSAQQLQQLLSPGGSLTQGYGNFNAPTAAQAAQQPGYQFAPSKASKPCRIQRQQAVDCSRRAPQRILRIMQRARPRPTTTTSTTRPSTPTARIKTLSSRIKGISITASPERQDSVRALERLSVACSSKVPANSTTSIRAPRRLSRSCSPGKGSQLRPAQWEARMHSRARSVARQTALEVH